MYRFSSEQGKSATKGFTLLELVVTVTIVAILAALAIPSYQSYIERSAVSETQQRMLALSTDLLRWRSKALTYRGFVPASGYAQANDILVPTDATLSNYRYKVTLVDAGTKASLGDATAIGTDWIMVAVPNSDNNTLKDGKRLYLRSNGERCLVASTVNLSTSTVAPCAADTSEPWK